MDARQTKYKSDFWWIGGLVQVDAHYYIMGQICSLCCGGPVGDQYLTLVLYKAIPKANLEIDLTHEIPKINQLIAKTKTRESLQLQHCTVVYSKQGIQGENYIPQLANKQRLIIKQIDHNQGVIVFLGGYYIGPLKDDSANGEGGQMYLIQTLTQPNLQQDVKFVIRGKWENDLLCKGDVFSKKDQLLFSLTWNSQNIAIRFEKGLVSEYRGKANFAAETLPGILTDKKATVIFRDGARYVGAVKNGIMHTDGQDGQFTSPDGKSRYKGPYVDGLRHGSSEMLIRQDLDIAKFKLLWQKGVPDYQSIVVIDGGASMIRGSSLLMSNASSLRSSPRV